MPIDKGLLSGGLNLEVDKILHNYARVMSEKTEREKARTEIISGVLSYLSGQADEELRGLLERLELQSLTNERLFLLPSGIDKILSLIAPIMVARVEAARVAERKAIGEKLIKIAGANKDAMWLAEELITGKTHQQLAEENYQEIIALTYGAGLKGEKPGDR